MAIFRSSHRRCSTRKGALRNFTKFTGKHLYQSLLLKKRLWHRCFPVNFAKFLKTLFLQNTSGRLLLYLRQKEISKPRKFMKGLIGKGVKDKQRRSATSKVELFVIIEADNYYHKELHLGCCSSPRSASGKDTHILNIFASNLHQEGCREDFWRKIRLLLKSNVFETKIEMLWILGNKVVLVELPLLFTILSTKHWADSQLSQLSEK